MIKDQLLKNLKEAITKTDIKVEEKDLDLQPPANPNFGDYATTIALKLAKKLKKSPLEVANNIIKNLSKNNLIEKAEVIKPGFINFWISNQYLLSIAKQIAQNKIEFNPVHFGTAKKIMVEYAHPNPLKLFHIGHLRNISTGESIVRILKASSNQVIRTNYQGDIGLHIAKCLWQIRKIVSEQGKQVFKNKNLAEKIQFIGKAYAQGNKAYENDEETKAEIIEVNKMIYEQNTEIMPLWKETRQWSLKYFETIYKRVYTIFDRLYEESEFTKRGLEIAYNALEKNILEKSKGAIIFNGKKYGLDTRVFINALGFPTYEGKELALAEKEFSEFGQIDKCIHVVGPEQTSFFKVTFKVEELIDPKKYKNKQYHLVYGWVRLKHGKMSSRSGNIVEGTWLLDEAKKKILEKFKCNDVTAETLAVAAIKYSFLKNSIQNDTVFDFDESITIEGNSAPYLIYTYVRTQSVLKKEQSSNLTMKQSFDYTQDKFNNKSMNYEEIDLLRTFYQSTEIIEKAALDLSPSYIATYLFKLAQKYNLFYQKHAILKSETGIRNLRLLLTKCVGEIIKNGLYLLGIKTVEKM